MGTQWRKKVWRCIGLLIMGSAPCAATACGQPQDSDDRRPTTQSKRILFYAGPPSHGYAEHEHRAGSILLAKCLSEAIDGIQTDIVTPHFPTAEQLAEADALVMYCDGGSGHPALDYLEILQERIDAGMGLVCIHYAVEVPKDKGGRQFLHWIGGYFETHWSVNPFWTARFAELPAHPVTRGVQPFEIYDEWYYHMRFPDDQAGWSPILTAVPPPETLSRPDGPHSGNPHVRAEAGQPQHVAWAIERPGGGRGFGFTGGHVHWNWGDQNFRRLMLNAIAWTARAEIPAEGLRDSAMTAERLESNIDKPQPENYDLTPIRRRLGLTK